MTFSTNTSTLSALAAYEAAKVVFNGPKIVNAPSPGPNVCLVIAAAKGLATVTHAPPT